MGYPPAAGILNVILSMVFLGPHGCPAHPEIPSHMCRPPGDRPQVAATGTPGRSKLQIGKEEVRLAICSLCLLMASRLARCSLLLEDGKPQKHICSMCTPFLPLHSGSFLLFACFSSVLARFVPL